MSLIRTLANFRGCIAYSIGPERWIPLLSQRVLCSVSTQERKIALTFDDGPNSDYTPLLLTKLAEHRVPATFFLIGRNLKKHPEIGRRIVQEGHEVGNHTYHHRMLPFLSRVQPGSIIILHDGYVRRFDRDKSRTVRAMDGLIPKLCEQGYEFVTLSQLVSA